MALDYRQCDNLSYDINNYYDDIIIVCIAIDLLGLVYRG